MHRIRVNAAHPWVEPGIHSNRRRQCHGMVTGEGSHHRIKQGSSESRFFPQDLVCNLRWSTPQNGSRSLSHSPIYQYFTWNFPGTYILSSPHLYFSNTKNNDLFPSSNAEGQLTHSRPNSSNRTGNFLIL